MRLPRLLAGAAAAVLISGGASAAWLVSHGSEGPASGDRSAGKAVLFAGPSPPAGAGAGKGGLAGTDRSPRAATPASGALSVPAVGVPLSLSADPVAPRVVTGPAAGRPAVLLPTPTAGSLPAVDGLVKAVTPDAVVMLSSSLTAEQQRAVAHLKGVAGVEVVDTGTVGLGDAPAVAFGVNPDTFRAFTPPASASSDILWRYLKGGSLVSSYPMADDRALRLGSTQTVTPAAGTGAVAAVQGWLGGFASIGLPGVDLLVDRSYSQVMGLAANSGIVVSAPGLPGVQLQSELEATLPGAAVELMSPQQLPVGLVGDNLSQSLRQQIVAAALSRVGLPYVWGGAGPSTFDCSGLTQWSYRQAGILLPRVAAQQYLTGDHIPLAAAQPGDLLFWSYDPTDPGYVDHEAMYLGGGMMVVAAHSGTNVEVTPVPVTSFMGAVQIVLQKP